MTDTAPTTDASTTRRWRPLESIERRVLGVLVEKAKTTPEAYPLSINALRTGCNQKNNRSPLMQLEEEQVEEACEQLRKSGAISQVQGSGRVDRYRHLAYEWLGVEKVELAVMAELLLRGSQTVGELRGRAARMEPIKDLGELQPTLDSLAAKGLIMYLTPPGRGCVVTHALYLDRELEKVRREAGALYAEAEAEDQPEPAGLLGTRRGEASPPPTQNFAPRMSNAPPAHSNLSSGDLTALRDELNTLKQELAATRADFESVTADLRRELDELNRQLGN
jgi:uncharacterized protein YceH (UPF0502 family)